MYLIRFKKQKNKRINSFDDYLFFSLRCFLFLKNDEGCSGICESRNFVNTWKSKSPSEILLNPEKMLYLIFVLNENVEIYLANVPTEIVFCKKKVTLISNIYYLTFGRFEIRILLST